MLLRATQSLGPCRSCLELQATPLNVTLTVSDRPKRSRAIHYCMHGHGEQALGSEERARTMLEDVDMNHDGQISFDEFSQMMRRL